ncbi:M20/M25/M40 family metallo-hydrolase [Natrinema gelatinilyticum]|uniref:M20/M25/M40 family metallo-hydrolase n=1 Tax=Natrinema gelatinilyticum TaxID=2961571 RepID=UPI0020C3D650|nr:M20/M25/M40 family metallo-hydrolase [Natrinema gelatinilyticum]
MTTTEPFTYLERRDDTFLDDLRSLLAQPSISATGDGIDDCVTLVRESCLEYGFDVVDIVETPGQPAVVAHASPDDEPHADGLSVLLYGHYDVQPATASEWASPPFEPTVRDGPDGRTRLYARGAGDNKGQWFAHLCAIRALRETTGVPIDVTLIIEGEEESGSKHLEWLVRERRDELDADVAFVADGPIDASGRPHVLLGSRGLLYVDIEATGANRDLHSGNFGGPVPNPATAIVELIASLRDEDGQIALESFYDDVRPLTDRDRDVLESIPLDEDGVKADLGLSTLATDPGEEYLERLLTRPNLNVAGLDAGYDGDGMKTVLPSHARAKIDFRLVADQDPDDVFELLSRHVEARAPAGIDVTVERVAAMAPQRTAVESPVVEPVMQAVQEGWGEDPILKPSLGGSVPTYVFADNLEIPCLVVPYANADENNHAPDENIELSCFRAGARTTVSMLEELSKADLE